MSEPGDRIGDRYRLTRRIASGGMGVVWQAEDEVLRRTVAVKQLRVGAATSEADAALARERAMREARITARLHHPHAVSIFDVVDHDGAPHIVMQYVPSASLSAVLRSRSTLPVEEVARIGAEVADALHAAHGLGIVHRDVKPANILVAEPGGEALLTDFGISHAVDDAALTSTGMLFGTPAYLAPEVALGAESTPASDVFSLGSTLYAAVEGRPPFGEESNGIAVLHRVAAASFAAPQRSGALQPVLLRMMRPDPADRPTMAEVAAALTAVATQAGDADAPTALLVPGPDGDATRAIGDSPTEQDRTEATLLAPAVAATPDVDDPAAAPTMRLATRPEEPAPRRRPRALPWLIGAAAVLVVILGGFGLLRAVSSGGPVPAPTASGPTVVARSVPPSSSTPRPTAATTTPAVRPSAPAAPAAPGGGSSGKGHGNGNGKDKGGNGKGDGKKSKGG